MNCQYSPVNAHLTNDLLESRKYHRVSLNLKENYLNKILEGLRLVFCGCISWTPFYFKVGSKGINMLLFLCSIFRCWMCLVSMLSDRNFLCLRRKLS